LIREHTEGIRPPRALYVPFELGSPFGTPNNPELQRSVLLGVLKLLERTNGPLIEDFEFLSTDFKGKSKNNEGWACPDNLVIPQNSSNNIEMLAIELKQEITFLQSWYQESVRNFKGRRLDGLTTHSPLEIIEFLISFIGDPNMKNHLSNQPIIRSLKLTSDDLKYFYFQSAMARPTNISDNQLENWFYGETLAGRLLIKIRAICLGHENEVHQLIGRTNFVPNAMLNYT
jgi:hypothetical protein